MKHVTKLMRSRSAMGVLVLLVGLLATPVRTDADFVSHTVRTVVCVWTWGFHCPSEVVVGTGPPVQITVTCQQPLLNGLPQFLTYPKGQAKYRFQSICTSPALPGAQMTVLWEGTWTPSETDPNRPNSSESMTITGFEPFIPDRAPGGKIFMYWTARCTRDPWLQSGGCGPRGSYVPDDLAQAFPDLMTQSFPRTGSVISASDRTRLYGEYMRINQPLAATRQESISSNALKSFTTPQKGVAVPKPTFRMRGIEPSENPPADQTPPEQTASAESAGAANTGGGSEDIAPSAVVSLERPIHFLTATGEDVVIQAGAYKIESVLDVNFALTKEGQPSILLQGLPGTHTEIISQPTALLIQGEREDLWHLVLLMPEGRRLDALGSASGVRPRGNLDIVPVDSKKLGAAGAVMKPGAGQAVSPSMSVGTNPNVTAELQRIAAEQAQAQAQAKAEQEPAALLARIKVLEWILACMYVEGYGTTYGPAFPPPKVYPTQAADVRWNGMKCPGK